MSALLHGDTYARGARHDYAVNTRAGPRPSWLAEAIRAGADALGSYPDERAAVAALAARHHRDPAEVMPLNGAVQAFSLLAAALRPRRPLVVHPSFTEPERALAEAGHPPRRLILEDPFTLDPAAVPDSSDLVVVGNPTNPTGVLHPRATLAALCRPGRTTVVDEAFMDFVPGEPESLAGERSLPGLVVVRSLTKLLAVPGARVGYLLAAPELAARLRHARPLWSVNSIALEVMRAAAAHGEHARAVADATASDRARLSAALAELHEVRVFPGAANFLLLEAARGDSIVSRLRDEHGVAVRPCGAFPGLDERHLRVAVRGAGDEPLVHALRSVLGDAPARTSYQ